jgi:hypothetical protein
LDELFAVSRSAGSRTPVVVGISWWVLLPLAYVVFLIVCGEVFATGRDRFTVLGIAGITVSAILVSPGVLGGQLVRAREQEWLEKLKGRPVDEKRRRRNVLNGVVGLGYAAAVIATALGAILIVAGLAAGIHSAGSQGNAARVLFLLGVLAVALGCLIGAVVKTGSDIASLFVAQDPKSEHDVLTLAEILKPENEARLLVVAAVAFFVGTTMTFLGAIL